MLLPHQQLNDFADTEANFAVVQQMLPAVVVSLPPAGVAYRGVFLTVEGGGDILYVCLQALDGSYSWIQIVSG